MSGFYKHISVIPMQGREFLVLLESRKDLVLQFAKSRNALVNPMDTIIWLHPQSLFHVLDCFEFLRQCPANGSLMCARPAKVNPPPRATLCRGSGQTCRARSGHPPG